jgi:hypothetical protein
MSCPSQIGNFLNLRTGEPNKSVKILLQEMHMHAPHQDLAAFDNCLWAALEAERSRQENQIELIASEDHASRRVMAAQGTVLTNKYG